MKYHWLQKQRRAKIKLNSEVGHLTLSPKYNGPSNAHPWKRNQDKQSSGELQRDSAICHDTHQPPSLWCEILIRHPTLASMAVNTPWQISPHKSCGITALCDGKWQTQIQNKMCNEDLMGIFPPHFCSYEFKIPMKNHHWRWWTWLETDF